MAATDGRDDSERDAAIAHLRQDYKRAELVEGDVDPDPIAQFAAWFAAARDAQLVEPNAMIVATVSPDGQPSARTVLLKAFDDRGFVFYTNYGSQKGRDLATNPRAALLFYWGELERQVRIEGTVARVDRAETERYFAGRPFGSRIGALASRQSEPVASREVLAADFARLENAYRGGEVPVPDDWGGYRLAPTSIEFWQGRPNRLHDRLRYRADPSRRWTVERLSP
ncbi:MAG: Pyridoxamine 5'-phosphate oxidase [uncultured Thermomicrobiales bacterium]|uniref:Pyridoxamine 5'-phosphate oxidase n=1 Tax=uncultured Thermomicrobiales bacterium TaxID=1645740 RepID=A0A6J4URF5_9BACT|nr:MAG: Pyridoxamine 5'-phosphate oxidase [uncultured Thermomicrobiales bacterium]